MWKDAKIKEEPIALRAPLPVFLPQPRAEDPWEEARHKWRKGRFEFMTGPTIFIQGNCGEKEGLQDNSRICSDPIWSQTLDPYAQELQVDITEQ